MLFRRMTTQLVLVPLVSFVGLCLTGAPAQSQTISPQKVFGRYQQFTWQDRHGLPQNTITSIVRTRDGYLWLGTLEGAVRFDGVRFVVFDTSNTRELRSNWISALLEDRHGSLWFGTYRGGIVRLTEGTFTHYGEEDGLADDWVLTLFEDRAGSLWIGTQDGRLMRFRDGRFTTYTTRDGLPAGGVSALAEDRDGNLWIGTTSGLAKFQLGQFTRYTARDGLADDDVRALRWDKDDRLWIGTVRGLTWFDRSGFRRSGGREMSIDETISVILQDREGSVWIGTRERGLHRFAGDRIAGDRPQDGLAGDSVMAIYQDPDGDLWIGTDGNGLSQFRDPRIRTITTENGLVHNSIRGIHEDSAGTIWIGTDQGLSRIVNGAVISYTTKDGLGDDTIRAIAEDVAGGIWIGTVGGLSRFRDGRFETWDSRKGLPSDIVVALLVDRAGNLWVGTAAGLARFHEGRFTVFTTRDGLVDDVVQGLYEDREGHLWIGTLRGMSRFKDGRFTSWSMKDGLPNNRVLSFYEDGTGGLWIGTHGGGLSRFKDGAFKVMTTRDGLYDNLTHDILEDGRGDVWMVSNRGIYRANVQALNALADGQTRSVPSFVYGVADGMLSREGNWGNPAGWKTRDGQLWFATTAGVAVIDPARQSLEPPLIAIEGVILDRQPLPFGDGIRIMPGQENLEIQYTALSWSRPHEIKFKYRLEGSDRDWVDAGTRRTAYYTHIPPGAYTFHVIADNGDGVWNTVGQQVAIVVLPPFYRTWWFIALGVASAVAVIGFAWRSRVAHLHRTQAVQEAFARQLMSSQESERRRIAGELHDSVGQSLVLIRNWAMLGSGQLASQAPAKEELNEISQAASQAINDVREIAYNLGPYHLERLGVANAIMDMVTRVANASGIRFTTDLDDITGALSRDAEVSLYRIAQEAVNNLVKHSEATAATVTIKRKAGQVTLTIEDNGKGFASRSSGPSSGQVGFGLTGIAERVRMLNGLWIVRSAPGQGTIVEVRLETRAGDDER